MNAYYKGEPILGLRGPAGPDGNPIGTVISFLGTSAPEDYLVCDGTAYDISDHPELADFFRQQFGTVNHFGGDGETTFAVPDMRNLFLRGFHGEAEEQLSGEIGMKQAATEHVGLHTLQTDYLQGPVSASVKNADAGYYIAARTYMHESGHDNGGDPSVPSMYTSRPVNMAVLFCIKAV